MKFMKTKLIILCIGFLWAQWGFGQSFSHADSLHGTLTTFRTCFDVKHYDLEVRVEPTLRRIAGSNTIVFKADLNFGAFQIDLHPSMEIAEIVWHGQKLEYRRDEGAVFVIFPRTISEGSTDSIKIVYSGTPVVAINPPWGGGFVWEKAGGKPWIGVACESEGASLWWPCKDHHSDEPDSMTIAVIVPDDLMAVSNGELKKTEHLIGNLKKYTWKVSYPINLYNVTLNSANYKHIADVYQNASGVHKLDYYILEGNDAKASAHFAQVKTMLACFEKYFGEYPFWRDGYALVETPYWGMEHQGAIAYGNRFENNEFGFDFILIHESAHEWFGNSVSMEDKSDMWIHESFATYAEAIYVEETQGKDKALAYLKQQKAKIENKSVIIAPRGVYYDTWEDADMYFKGTWMLHTLRIMVNDDKRWFATIKTFCETYRIQTINSVTAIRFFNKELGKDYTWLFDEYLRNNEIPVLEYKITKSIFWNWKNQSHKGLHSWLHPLQVKGNNQLSLHPLKRKETTSHR